MIESIIIILLISTIIILSFKLRKKIEIDQQIFKDYEDIKRKVENATTEYNNIVTKKNIEINHLDEIEQLAKINADKFYEQNIETAKIKIEQYFQKLSEDIEKEKKEYEEDLLLTMEEMSKDASSKIQSKHDEIQELDKILSDLKNKYALIVEKLQKDEEEQYCTIQLDEKEKIEIQKLREIAPYFRNPRPIYKIIWESYYRDATNEMINFLKCSGKSGIYAITNLDNKKMYIGQSNNIGDRLKQHIKCGIGIDTPVNSKLYKSMKEDGVENFSFEVLERCPKEELNEKEKYWISLYQSQTWGYNVTSGGS